MRKLEARQEELKAEIAMQETDLRQRARELPSWEEARALFREALDILHESEMEEQKEILALLVDRVEAVSKKKRGWT